MKSYLENNEPNQNDIMELIKRNQRVIMIAVFALLVVGTATYFHIKTNAAASNCTSTVCTNGYKWIFIGTTRFCVTC